MNVGEPYWQEPNQVELRIYDTHGAEQLRVHEFVSLRFEEELHGGSGMMEAVVRSEVMEALPQLGFALARIYVTLPDVETPECWWAGFIEETNPSSDGLTCRLVGHGLQRALSWVKGRYLQWHPYWQPIRNALGATMSTYDDPWATVGEGIIRLTGGHPSYLGLYGQWLSSTASGLSTTGIGAFAKPSISPGPETWREQLDTVLPETQGSPATVWWVDTDGVLRMDTMPSATADTLVLGSDLLEVDARCESTDIVNRVCVRAPASPVYYPHLVANWLQYNPNFTEWNTEPGSGVLTPTCYPGRQGTWEWATYNHQCSQCVGWMAGFGVGNQGVAGLTYYRQARHIRWPWDESSGVGRVQLPRGLGDAAMRLEVERAPGATGPLVVAVATAWSDWLQVGTDWLFDEDKRANGFGSGTMGLWAVISSVSPAALSDAEFQWRVAGYDSSGATIGVYTSGWLPATGATNSGAAWPDTSVYHQFSTTAAGIDGAARTFVELALRMGNVPGDVADNLVVHVYGIQAESTASGPADFAPYAYPSLHADVSCTWLGISPTEPIADSMERYGVRYAIVDAPAVISPSPTDVFQFAANYLRAHAKPTWTIRGWTPQFRRWDLRSGYYAILGDQPWCGQAFALTRVIYTLDSGGSMYCKLQFGDVLTARLPTEEPNAADDYVPPFLVEGSFGLPRYWR